MGFIRVSIKQKETNDPNKKHRPLSNVFGGKDSTKNIYDNFAKQASEQKNVPAQGFDPNLVNPVDSEAVKIDNESDPQAE